MDVKHVKVDLKVLDLGIESNKENKIVIGINFVEGFYGELGKINYFKLESLNGKVFHTRM